MVALVGQRARLRGASAGRTPGAHVHTAQPVPPLHHPLGGAQLPQALRVPTLHLLPHPRPQAGRSSLRATNFHPPHSHGRSPADTIAPRCRGVLLCAASGRAHCPVVAARHAGGVADLPPHGAGHASRALASGSRRAAPAAGEPCRRQGVASRASPRTPVTDRPGAAVASTHPQQWMLPRTNLDLAAAAAGAPQAPGGPAPLSRRRRPQASHPLGRTRFRRSTSPCPLWIQSKSRVTGPSLPPQPQPAPRCGGPGPPTRWPTPSAHKPSTKRRGNGYKHRRAPGLLLLRLRP